ncbi:5-enol-pyruvylshikimate-phosphate synthase, partial [Tanacetum coccineum]
MACLVLSRILYASDLPTLCHMILLSGSTGHRLRNILGILIKALAKHFGARLLVVESLLLPGVKLSGSISSQYLTTLLMAAPLALGDVEIEIIDKLISMPYVEMTLKLMERFSVSVEHSDTWDRFYVRGGQKSPGNAYVEGDALSGSYFLTGAAITGGTITGTI